MNELSNYAFSPLREGEIALYRGSGEDLPPILLVAAEEDSLSAVERLQHEYALKAELDADWTARPVVLIHYNRGMALVLEDPGGEPLDGLLGRPQEVSDFLRIAIPLAGALRRVHERGLIHKDIKPTNILADRASGGVWLTGFGIASRLPRERQAPAPPEVIAGTLAYMAPEQTGRMNRSVDSRSDLYALGVTFYEMLTGILPFTAADPIEWVHCHIARLPVPPTERVATIPGLLSAIVMKLLAKTAEERYQTAAGVEVDLRLCLAAWEAHNRIQPFALGAQDVSDRLLIPEKLYGREHEIDTLLASFDRVVATGNVELVLVSGYSGIGKSSVVNELHKVLVPRGLFASGKFDQYKRDIPYATLGQAFQSLVRSLLAQTEGELGRWHDSLSEALAPNGKLMVDLVPELEFVIGKQPPVAELPPQDAKNRFQMVLRRFLGVFARKEHPLALFLDDLQWLDAATLGFLEHLVTQSEVRHLLLIGAYRDNEVGPSHPFRRTLEEIRRVDARVHEIVLTPLGLDDVGRLIADALHCEPERVRPLAELIQEKTGGNPFFAIQFFTALAEEGLLVFDSVTRAWQWDMDHVRAKSYTDNVVDLMAVKLKRLSSTTREALKQLACLGNAAPIATLALVLGTTQEAVHAALWDALRAGLVLHQESTIRFVHDRIQQAAYSLIPEAHRADIHLRIGRMLLAGMMADDLVEHLFDVANQFNRGAALLVDRNEKAQVAAIELRAGRKAKASMAHASACVYLGAGMALLDETDWDSHYDLTFSLWLECAECEYLTGQLASAEARLSLLSSRARTIVDSAAVTCVRLNLYTTLDHSDGAVEVGLDYLLRVDDERWPLHATAEDVRQAYDRLLQRLGSGSVESLVDLPLMIDPDRRATMDVLTMLTSPALFTEENLFRLVVCRMATLSLEHGNSDGSSLAYAWLGSVLGMYFGDYQAGLRFGRLGLDLVEKRGLDRFKARVYLVSAVHVVNWTQNLSISRGLLRRAFEAAQETGDLSYVAYSRVDLVTNFLAAGDPLGEAEREAEHGLEFVRKLSFGLISDCMIGQLRLIRVLRGLRPVFTSFDGTEFDEGRFEQRLDSKPQLAFATSWYWIRKLQASVYAGDFASAVSAASKAASVLWTTPTQFEVAEYHFYAALARAACCDIAAPNERLQHLEALTSHLRQIAVWANNCPATFANRAALVGAEFARLDRRELDAERLYETAIRSAREHGFVQNEGLAHEVAARFYAARGFDTIARAYLREARRCYLRWGAFGKVQQLERLHPHLRDVPVTASSTATLGTPVEQLDVATVVKASQAVSGEILLDKLIETLLRITVEHAGAERGLLILFADDGPRIVAEATTGGQVHVMRRPTGASTTALPKSVLHYVARTRESVILRDASTQNQFSADEYLRQKHVRSVLCLPLVEQSKLIGALYLENNLASHVFTPARITILEMLAAQAAISLENARLYSDLLEREARIRRLVDSNIIGIFFLELEGRIIDANDMFLNMLGYDREDLISGRLNWTDLTPPEWRDRTAWAVEQVKMVGSLRPYEKEFFRKDGSRVPVLLGSAAFNEQRDQGVAFVLDLTERKRAEVELRESEQNYRMLFESIDEGFCTIEVLFDQNEKPVDYRFLQVSPSFERQTGIKNAAGRRMREIAPQHEEYWFEIYGRIALTGETRRFENEAKQLGRWYDVYAFPVEDPPHSRVGILFNDITERKQAEEKLRASEQRLLDAQMSLAQANRVTTMGQLTASIAHEVKQPIAATVTNAEAALRFLGAEAVDTNQLREILLDIVKDGNRAGEVINRINDLIKKAPPRRDRLEVNGVLREVIEFTRGATAKSRVSVHAELAESLPLVSGDRVELQQVILNLVMNGIEAMQPVEDRSRELEIRSRQDEQRVLISVTDCGIGLPAGNADRLFSAFFTTKSTGMGMGLSICRSIIEAHRGRLWATANLPHGATFQFTLPVDPDPSS
jgi:PAS domain S-box-containing protein